MDDHCLPKLPKKASGISVFLMEELGDARLRCGQLKKYVDEAVKLIEKSDQKDHFFEVAGHLLYGIPDTLLRLEKALNASAMAVSRWDYEDTKDELRPEKAEQLEAALEDVRVRRVQRRTETATQALESPMKINEAVARLNRLAASIEATGSVDHFEVASLIAELEPKSRVASDSTAVATTLRGMAASLQSPTASDRPSPSNLAKGLRAIVASTLDIPVKAADELPLTVDKKPFHIEESFESILEHAKVANRKASTGGYKLALQELGWMVFEISTILRGIGMPISADQSDRLGKLLMRAKAQLDSETIETLKQAGVVPAPNADAKAAEAKRSRFEEGKPADPTENMDEEDASKWKVEHLDNKDNFKSATDEKESRHEEGKPADPTQDMSEEDANKWKVEHLKNKDNFKAAAMDSAKFEKVVLPKMKDNMSSQQLYAVLEELLEAGKITPAEFRWLEADAEDYETMMNKNVSDKSKREEGRKFLEQVKAKLSINKGVSTEFRVGEDGDVTLEVSEDESDPGANQWCAIVAHGEGDVSIQVSHGRGSESVDGLKRDVSKVVAEANKLIKKNSPGLIKTAMQHSSPEAMRKYLHEHPGADPKKHFVEKGDVENGGSVSRGDSEKVSPPKSLAEDIERDWEGSKHSHPNNPVSGVMNLIKQNRPVSLSMMNKALIVLKNVSGQSGISKAESDKIWNLRKKIKEHASVKEASTSWKA